MKFKLVDKDKLCERYSQFKDEKAGAYMDGFIDLQTPNGVVNMSVRYVSMCFTPLNYR